MRQRSSAWSHGSPARPASGPRDRRGSAALAGGDRSAPSCAIGQRRPEPDGHGVEGTHQVAPRGLHRPGADDADRDDRHIAPEGEPGHAGVALVEAGVGGPRPLGVDAEQVARRRAPRWRCRGPAARRPRRSGSWGSVRRPGRTRPSSSCRSTRPWPHRSPGAAARGAGRTSRRTTGGWRPAPPGRGPGCARGPRPGPATAGRRRAQHHLEDPVGHGPRYRRM